MVSVPIGTIRSLPRLLACPDPIALRSPETAVDSVPNEVLGNPGARTEGHDSMAVPCFDCLHEPTEMAASSLWDLVGC